MDGRFDPVIETSKKGSPEACFGVARKIRLGETIDERTLRFPREGVGRARRVWPWCKNGPGFVGRSWCPTPTFPRPIPSEKGEIQIPSVNLTSVISFDILFPFILFTTENKMCQILSKHDMFFPDK